MTTKKMRERSYLERIRDACPDFPRGEVQEFEEPDFLICDKNDIIGVELRGIFHRPVPSKRSPREVEGIREKILSRAKKDYLSKGNPIVQAWFIFHDARFERGRFDAKGLSASIARLVAKNVPPLGKLVHVDRVGIETKEEYPWELGPISILRPDYEDDPHFTVVDAGFVPECDSEYLQSCIDDKEKRLPTYRRSCAYVWLVLTVYGEGISSFFGFPEHVMRHKYTTDFDRVYIFNSTSGKCQRLSIA